MPAPNNFSWRSHTFPMASINRSNGNRTNITTAATREGDDDELHRSRTLQPSSGAVQYPPREMLTEQRIQFEVKTDSDIEHYVMATYENDETPITARNGNTKTGDDPLSSNRKRRKNGKEEKSGLARADLRRYRWSFIGPLTATILSIFILCAAMGVGAEQAVFRFGSLSLLGNSIDSDLQLALLGLINKILDFLVTVSLENVMGVLLTWLMISRGKGRSGGGGVGLEDLELKEEIIKPWRAVAAFVGRCKLGYRGEEQGGRFEWSVFWASLGRFAFAMATSLCILTLGLAINTVGMPKERWYPPLDTAMPMTTYSNLVWTSFSDRATAALGGGNASDPAEASMAQYALMSTNTFEALMGLPDHMPTQPYGWMDFSQPNPEVPPAVLALDTRYNGSWSRGYAWQGEILMDIFGYLQQHGDAIARKAIGMSGRITVAVPTVSVECGTFLADEYLTSLDGQPWNGTVFTNGTLASQGHPTFQVSLKPLPDSNFSGTTCTFQTGTMLFPGATWIINTDGSIASSAFSANAYEASVNDTGILLDEDPVDALMASQLVTGMSIVFEQWDRLFPNRVCGDILLAFSRSLQGYRPDYASSDVASLAPVLALAANHLLSVANWGYNHTSDSVIPANSSQIQWQVYGSGPRLRWEWVSTVILAWLAIVLIASLGLVAYLRIAPGEWLTTPGMLVAAGTGPRLKRVQAAVQSGEEERALAEVRIVVANVGAEDEEQDINEERLGVVALVDDVAERKAPRRGKEYRWVGSTS
jgi:hypothetical protein